MYGANFINSPCTAKVGFPPSSGVVATSCMYASASQVIVVIGAGTPAAILSVEVTFTSSAKTVTVPGTLLRVSFDPMATSVLVPNFEVYAGSTVTVNGVNFINASCSAKVGTMGTPPSTFVPTASCAYISENQVTIVIGQGTPPALEGSVVELSLIHI